MNADNLRTLGFRIAGQACDYRATAPATIPGAFDHLVGKVNAAPFLARPAASVLLHGYGMYAHDLATGRDVWEFHFTYRPRPWDCEAADFTPLVAHLEGHAPDDEAHSGAREAK